MTYEILPSRQTAGAVLTYDAEAIRLLNEIIGDVDVRLTSLTEEAPSSNQVHSIISVDEPYTIDTSYAGTHQIVTSATPITATIPLDNVANFTSGSFIYFQQAGAGQLTISPADGVTLYVPEGTTNKTRGLRSVVKAYKLTVNTWLLANDLAPAVQAITAAGAIDLLAPYVTITGPTSSTYAITLAAPPRPNLRKTLEMIATTATNAVTLALTNVAGGSAATTATFDAAGETLVLESNSTKWLVMKEVGVTLS